MSGTYNDDTAYYHNRNNDGKQSDEFYKHCEEFGKFCKGREGSGTEAKTVFLLITYRLRITRKTDERKIQRRSRDHFW